MNPGGEPERDDTGLPPVDIEVPDDARELDRDVQAYHRELRAQRRQQRGLRVRGSLAKDGIVLPLLACCLILALITGTLLTVFTATSDVGGPVGIGQQTARPPAASRAASGGAGSAGARSSASTAPAGTSSAQPTPQPGTVPGVLPGATIAVAGHAPLRVGVLRQAALVLVPQHCNCTATVAWLIHVVTGAHAQPYLVYNSAAAADVQRLYASLSLNDRAQVQLAATPGEALRDSVPDTLPGQGLAAIFIGPKKTVLYATALSPRDDPTTLIKALTH